MMSKWTAEAVIGLRGRLGVEQDVFARIFAVDKRTVVRWETGECEPAGASEAMMFALMELLEKMAHDPERIERLVRYVVYNTKVAGLSYLLQKLLEKAVDGT